MTGPSKEAVIAQLRTVQDPEIHQDIVSQATSWNSLTKAVRGTPALTRLRCFDIVAWRLGATK